MNEARDALGAISPYYQPPSWNPGKWELTEEDTAALIRELKAAHGRLDRRGRRRLGRTSARRPSRYPDVPSTPES
jgi:hypothetical protein